MPSALAVNIEPWLKQTTERILDELKASRQRFLHTPPEEIPADKYKPLQNRYDMLQKLLDEPEGRKPNGLKRVINGFLTEFIRQTEKGETPVNIEYGKNPAARAEWEKRPPEEFRNATVAGVMQSISGFRKFKSFGVKDKAAWDALGEIIATSTKIFHEEYPKLETGLEPRASVYNAPLYILGVMSKIEHVFKVPQR